jgi:hypothetical protein
MLLETGLLASVLYFSVGGQSVRAAARSAGRIVGRTSGSLRRVRAEMERVQARAEALGGAELRAGRADVAARMAQLRAIQAEASALLSGAAGSGSGRAFSDAELSEAMGIAQPAQPSQSVQPGGVYVTTAPAAAFSAARPQPRPSGLPATPVDDVSVLIADLFAAERGGARR